MIGHEIQLRTAKAFLVELEKHILQNTSFIAPVLPYINAHLHSAIMACRAAKSSTEFNSFLNRSHIPSRKKNELQWRFTRTTKPPARKRKGDNLKWVWQYLSKPSKSHGMINNKHPDTEKRQKLIDHMENYSKPNKASIDTTILPEFSEHLYLHYCSIQTWHIL